MWWFPVAMCVMLAGAAPAQDTAATGAIAGTVAAVDGAPIADAAVCIPAAGRCELTGPSGAFRFPTLRAASYVLEVSAPNRPLLPVEATVRAGRDTVLEIALPDAQSLGETITVTAPRFVAAEELKTSAFLISAADIAQSAGALQDVARYVQSLPGVVIGTDDFRNDLIVRGGSPLENLYIVDNVEIPNINTFATFASAGGTVSMLDAALLEDVTFLTGGFPAAYGTRASSVLQVALREGDRSRTGGRVTFGFAGLGAIAEGGLGSSRGSWAVSLRRSVLDLFTDDTGIGGVPVLYTLNGKITYDLTAHDRVWLLNVSGADSIRLGLTDDSDLTSELSTVDIRYRGRRYATGINWQRTFGGRGVGLLGVTHSRAAVDQRVRDVLRGGGVVAPGATVEEQIAASALVFREDSGESEAGIKYDLTLNYPHLGKIQGGAGVKRLHSNYDAASPFGSDGPYFAEADAHPFALRESRVTTHADAYAQLSRMLWSRVGVTAGVRGDRFGYLGEWRVAPRLAFDVQVAPQLSANVAMGQYYQQPFLQFIAAFPQNGQITPFRADHLVTGLQWRRDAQTRVTVEGYLKRYRAYPVSSDVPSLSLANVGDTFALRDVLFPLVSSGTGRSKGVEFLIERKRLTNARWSGQLNIAASSTQHAGLDGVLRAGSFDYPVVVNATGSWQLTRRWELAARVAYLSGRPYTPIDQAASSRQRRAVYDLNLVNAARGRDYFRADLRVDRQFTVNGKPVTVFAGAQNVTNRKNFASFSWDRRNNRLRSLEQLGLFPLLGLDWQF